MISVNRQWSTWEERRSLLSFWRLWMTVTETWEGEVCICSLPCCNKSHRKVSPEEEDLTLLLLTQGQEELSSSMNEGKRVWTAPLQRLAHTNLDLSAFAFLVCVGGRVAGKGCAPSKKTYSKREPWKSDPSCFSLLCILGTGLLYLRPPPQIVNFEEWECIIFILIDFNWTKWIWTFQNCHS